MIYNYSTVWAMNYQSLFFYLYLFLKTLSTKSRADSDFIM